RPGHAPLHTESRIILAGSFAQNEGYTHNFSGRVILASAEKQVPRAIASEPLKIVFSECPGNCVHDVGFTDPIVPDHDTNPGIEIHFRPGSVGPESVDYYLFEKHPVPLR